MTDFSHATIRLTVDGSVLEYSWSDFALAMHADHIDAGNSSTLNIYALQDTVDVLWILTCSMQILLFQVGLAFLPPAVSLPDSKSFGLVAVVVLLSYAFTFALSFGTGTFFGHDGFFLLGIPLASPTWAFWVLHSTGAVTMTSVVYHALADRVSRGPLFLYILLLNTFVFPVLVHALWSSHGSVSSSNPHPSALYGTAVVDYAGASALHVCAGMAVLIASCFSRSKDSTSVTPPLGPPSTPPPTDNLLADHSRRPPPTSSPPFAETSPETTSLYHSIGSFFVFVAHFGLIHLSSPTLRGLCPDVVVASCVNLVLSSAASCIVSSVLSLYVPTKHPMNHGLLSGLVAMSAAASSVASHAAIIIGAVAGFVFVTVSTWTRLGRLDDALDVIAIHLGNGVWALVGAGMFSYGDRIALANACTFAAVTSTTAVPVATNSSNGTTSPFSQPNITTTLTSMTSGGCEFSMWQGCGRQVSANVVWTVVVLVFVGLMCAIWCVPLYLKGWWAADKTSLTKLPYDPLQDFDEFYPTDDEGTTPWGYHDQVPQHHSVPVHSPRSPGAASSDGSTSPTGLLCDGHLQSSVERRYKFSPTTSFLSGAPSTIHDRFSSTSS
ncbi:hypothetical protein DYB30_012040 [Aphanomyces astaci]|uniref:Ammonium transporter AmtB-like domain-containing protein n=1 Tax=Aphanomyces astaci TaxID=112090 RepID=A0A397EBH3_APHAT|nr:hypothetical protein DYB30_012040 [Aphanomyces astaci]